MRRAAMAAIFALGWTGAAAQADPAGKEGDFVVHNFHFKDGSTLPDVVLTTRPWARPSATDTATSPTRS